MKKNILNFWVDLFSMLVMFGLIWTGFLIEFVLPPRQRSILWGWDRHQWGELHFYLAIALIGLMFIHIWLHWNWFCMMMAKIVARKNPQAKRYLITGLLCAIALTSLTAGSLVYLKSQVHIERETGRRAGHLNTSAPLPTDLIRGNDNLTDYPENSNIFINGRTTIRQASLATGKSINQITSLLGLPDNTNPDLGLGQAIAANPNLTMRDIREILLTP